MSEFDPVPEERERDAFRLDHVQLYLDGRDIGHRPLPASGIIYIESQNPDGTPGYGFEDQPPLWLPIEQAKEDPDREIFVWAAPCEDLPGFACWCAWHPDAGFCVDELRKVTHYLPISRAPGCPAAGA